MRIIVACEHEGQSRVAIESKLQVGALLHYAFQTA